MLQNRDELRLTYFTAWEKHLNQLPLNAVEKQIVAVIVDHPEYHAYFANKDNQHRDYLPEDNVVNPFLHLGLHIAIRDQIHTNTPVGILDAYVQLIKKRGHPLEAEHAMMDCLAETIWQMQRSGVAPDMQDYLEKIKLLS